MSKKEVVKRSYKMRNGIAWGFFGGVLLFVFAAVLVMVFAVQSGISIRWFVNPGARTESETLFPFI